MSQDAKEGAWPWLVIADGEGSANTRICRTHAEIVQFLWEQCGHDYTGDEEHARNAWFAWLEDGDNWQSRDDVPQFHAETEVGETGRIEIQWMGAALADLLAQNERLVAALDEYLAARKEWEADRHPEEYGPRFARLQLANWTMLTALNAAKGEA